jgi:hypothetical protein
MLTPEEIQLVRVREMVPGEKVRMQIPPAVRKKAVAAGLLTTKDLATIQDTELAVLVFEKGEPELQREIKVVGEPAALSAYRTKVNRALVSGCATAACHGGPAGGRLLLYGPANKEQTDLTNFVILQKFEGQAGGVPRYMIDRTQPLNSLLLGYLLPPTATKVAHPDVQGFRPLAKSATDPTFVAVRDWMGKTLSAKVPNYDDIDLTQGAKPATDKPAGAAAR